MTDFVYLITSDKIGSQDPELGARLMSTFFLKLVQASVCPRTYFLWKGAYFCYRSLSVSTP